ncbi:MULTISPECIES: DegT/DnrJ/EryC1/StrS family aminotransferase [Lysinibacillus]|uniref:DegT/DnrJ/EryC1/StrS family aminotransferase n=1 Tax=Lysinibacillus xylanilyticus TaxID=582475 RepID=A0ABV3VX16_9BACI
MILVTKPFLPKNEEYIKKVNTIFENNWITNNGPFSQKLEYEITNFLEIPSLHFLSNGTMALHLSIKALDLKGEVITSPFSFVATTTSIIWEKCTPVYVDIHPDTLCIDPDKIEAAITKNTTAILATHVYGIPCDVEKIEIIAKKHNLKVIYDAAHAFGVKFKGKSLLNYGDISTLSFHATKLFHTVEGGGIVNNLGEKLDKKITLLRNFGFEGDNYYLAGVNAKNSEFHAAMGLCNLPYVSEIINKRKKLVCKYNEILADIVQRPSIPKETEYNYSYYPIIFKTAEQLLNVQQVLLENKIQTRRYFFPSLNNLPYLYTSQYCPISENIASRVLCLPLYFDLEIEMVEEIAYKVREVCI